MLWRNRQSSTNIEDRRGESPGGGPGGMIPIRGKGGVLILIIVLVAGYYGIDLTPLLTGGEAVQTQASTSAYKPSAEEQELAQFTGVALKTTEETWSEIFKKAGSTYTPPTLVLYRGSTRTACGYGQSAMGPFYCPPDRRVYIDLSFYEDMKTRLGGGGDFALGYVLAHEVGHHVQNLLGISDKVREAQSRTDQAGANRLSVRLELQADCFAGVWGNFMKRDGVLEKGDLEKALRTASAIGDDRLQRESTGRVVPDSFTHGTSEQRYRWFKRGYDTGRPQACNTFGSDNLDNPGEALSGRFGQASSR
ncbi:MAG: neutral zinc metallopeptidase [Mesosutterella sp.]|nr:neutral zinc metallopeptidase [Mesosutterella sp.]